MFRGRKERLQEGLLKPVKGRKEHGRGRLKGRKEQEHGRFRAGPLAR